MKTDLVMWTKNGEKTLFPVLKRIEKVIPIENIGQKIIVDNQSVDDTRKIAKEFNWKIYENPGQGIPTAANKALSLVETKFFITFEQDLYLNKNWFNRIPGFMNNPKVAVASGIRVYSCTPLKELNEFLISRDKGLISIDNNILRTKLIKALGGFPYTCPMCMDTILYKRIKFNSSFKWIIDKKVISLHFRNGLKDFIDHMERKKILCVNSPFCAKDQVNYFSNFRLFCSSPIRALEMGIKKKCPGVFWLYPYIRFMMLR